MDRRKNVHVGTGERYGDRLTDHFECLGALLVPRHIIQLHAERGRKRKREEERKRERTREEERRREKEREEERGREKKREGERGRERETKEEKSE